MSGSVTVVGSINADYVTRARRLPRAGETVVGSDFVRYAGGKGANQAVAAARLGATVHLVGATGEDADGVFVRQSLSDDAVDLRDVASLGDRPTGTAIVVVDDAAENLIIVSAGANRAVPDTVIESAVARAGEDDVVSVALEGGADAARAALSAAPSGVRTILNLSPVSVDALELIPQAWFVVMNEHECDDLLRLGHGASWGESAAALRRFGARNVVVTRGALGAVLYQGVDGAGEIAEIAAPTVDAVDTTGCGDAFTGALAASLAENVAPAEAVRRALVVASTAATRQGAQSSYPRRADLDFGVAGQVSEPGPRRAQRP